MTSRLRKKRRTTVLNTRPTTIINDVSRQQRLLALWLTFVAVVLGLAAPGSAQESVAKPPSPKHFTPPVHARPIEQARRPSQLPRRLQTAIRPVSGTQDPQFSMSRWRQRSDAQDTTNLNNAEYSGQHQRGFSDSLSVGSAPEIQVEQEFDPPPELSLEPPASTKPNTLGDSSTFPRPSVTQSRQGRQDQGQSVLVDSTPSRDASQNQLRAEPPPLRQSPTVRQDFGAPVHRQPANSRPLRINNAAQQFDAGQEGRVQGRGQRSCEEYRLELLGRRITDIVVDISAPRPQLQTVGDLPQQTRTWTDCRGNILGTGRLVQLQRSYIVIENDSGQREQIATTMLSDGDLIVLTDYWALPRECSMGCFEFEGRSWIPNTVPWKASGLCHKPLYYENIQLERYGHSHGPILQPIHSTAHFFVRFATWPYQAAIHPPNECQYALGFYRPGSCAPWLKDPIPISLKGAVYQAGAVAAVGGIIP